MKTLFKKLEDYFLVESAKIESATFLCKTTLSKTDVKTDRMTTAKWSCHKKRSFVSKYFIFSEILF